MTKLEFLELNKEVESNDIIFFGNDLDYNEYEVIGYNDIYDKLKDIGIEKNEIDEYGDISEYIDYDSVVEDMREKYIILDLEDFEDNEELN